jgi:1-acyl-sn-glycerol-3-phosphate acyltransferase
MSISKLLLQRRFGPLFLTQFAGALNDNIFKNAIVILLSYRAASETESGFLVNAAGGLFILPFFLFSGIAGRVADKYDKGRVMRAVKLSEICIMALGAIGFYVSSQWLLFTALFLMGVHSTFFGPVKYSILPQHLEEKELIAGNALIEMGTFLAILIGTLLGGALAGHGQVSVIASWILGVALAGWFFSQSIPQAPPADPGIKLEFNFMSDIREMITTCRQREGIWNAVMGISWFWYFGSTFLAQLPSFSKHTLLSDNPAMTTVLLATFSISVGIGSLITERLSRGELELGMVPLGALGMSIFSGDLFFIDLTAASSVLLDWPSVGIENVQVPWRVLFDVSMTGISGSLFIVPLYAYLQYRSEERTRSRLIAANNVANAIFMVGSAVFTILFYKGGLNTVQIIFITAIMNLVVTTWVITLIPEFLMRFIIWLLASTIYRLRYTGRELIPSNGPALIVANHISYIDWFIVTAACRRPVRFVMYHFFFKIPGIHVLAAAAKAIPIAPAKEDAALKEKSFEAISDALREGHVVCIFPEGGITRDGTVQGFRPGVERILAKDPVPVYLMSLGGLWGSFFSRVDGHAMRRMPHPKWRVISITVKEFKYKDQAITSDPGTTGLASAMENEVRDLLAHGNP